MSRPLHYDTGFKKPGARERGADLVDTDRNEQTLYDDRTSPQVYENRITGKQHVAAPSPYDAFSEEQVAEMLGVEPHTIRNLVLRSRELAYVPIGKTRRILRRDLEAFLDRRRVATVDELSGVAKKG